MTTLDLAAIEADLQRQLDRTEPMISIRAETLRGLIAAAKEARDHVNGIIGLPTDAARAAVIESLYIRMCFACGSLDPLCPCQNDE